MKINSVKKNFAGLVAMAVTIVTVQLVSAQSNVFNVFNYQGALQVTNNSGGYEPAPDGDYTCYCWPFWWHCTCPIPVPWNCPDCPYYDFTNIIYEYPGEVSLDQLQVSTITLRQGVFTMPFSVDQAFLNSNINSGTLYVQLWVKGTKDANPVAMALPQQVTSVPFSAVADTASTLSGTVSAGQLTGTLPPTGLNGPYGNPLNFSNPNNTYTGNGSGLTNVNASTLDGYGYCDLPCYWDLTGNAGTTQGVNFLGTTDNKWLEFRANNGTVGRLIPFPSGDPSLQWGANNGVTLTGNGGNVICGGGQVGHANLIYSDYSVIGGGIGNRVNLGDNESVIAGGEDNAISSSFSVIGGGSVNVVSVGAYNAFLGGGSNNLVSGVEATVPGGGNNIAGGSASFAAGEGAHATNNNTFVWSDGSSPAVTSTANNQFLIQATGGVGIGTSSPTAPLHVSRDVIGGLGKPVVLVENTDTTTSTGPALRVFAHGSPTIGALTVSTGVGFVGTGATTVLLASFGNADQFVSTLDNNGNWLATGSITANAFISVSDRNAKENFQDVSAQEVLNKVTALPLTRWNFKKDTGTQHIGPMAQDFQAAFQLSADDKHISLVDEGGVALAAIQGLNQKVDQKDAEIQSLKQQNDSLTERLNELEAAVKQIAAQK